jgi:hypothetical protein
MIWLKIVQYFKKVKCRIYKTKIFAVYESDIERLLQEMNLLDKIKNGKILCINCGKKIEIHNIGGILKKGESIEIYCDNKNCLSNTTLEVING